MYANEWLEEKACVSEPYATNKPYAKKRTQINRTQVSRHLFGHPSPFVNGCIQRFDAPPLPSLFTKISRHYGQREVRYYLFFSWYSTIFLGERKIKTLTPH